MGQNGEARGLDLKEYVSKVADELAERVEHQRRVLVEFAEGREQEGKTIDYCPLIDCRPLQKYRAGVKEAIRVLEETRRSFKSRQLEQLRKQFEKLLAEDVRSRL